MWCSAELTRRRLRTQREYGMEPSVEQATADIGTIIEIVVLSVLLFGWSFFVRHGAKGMRKDDGSD
jgi:hypothetical protein